VNRDGRLELLGTVEAAHPIAYASLGVTVHARHLVAYLASMSAFPVRDFDEAYTPLAQAELDRDECGTLGRSAIGRQAPQPRCVGPSTPTRSSSKACAPSWRSRTLGGLGIPVGRGSG
jgi:hypothetical protein